MAYSIPWDESDPPGATTPADTIDTEIQEHKKSIRERIEDVIPDWSNDAVQPKTLWAQWCKVSKTGSTNVGSGSGTNIIWTSEDWDVGGMVDLGTNADRVTLPVDGTYEICGVIFFGGQTGATEVRALLTLQKNIGAVVLEQRAQNQGQASTVTNSMEFNMVHAFDANDYIEISVAGTGEAWSLTIANMTVRRIGEKLP